MANWINRAIGLVDPIRALNRERAAIALDLIRRSYEGATTGRRSQGWRKSIADANATTWGKLGPLRDVARDLVRNNPYAESALSTIADHAVGWGISPSEAPEIWKRWAETTDCDADGRNDFYGLEKLVMRTVVESGECLVRRRIRKPGDGFALPMQLQILEPDYLDSLKDGTGSAGGQIIQGVEYNGIGQRIGYWMFRDHPGSRVATSSQSVFVPAESVLHVGRQLRPGQVRFASWFAPVLLRFKDFDDFEDATLMKQKIAACLAVIVSNSDGSASPLGVGEADSQIDSLEPGMIKTMSAGQTVTVVDPPQVTDYEPYSKTQLRAIATGLGVTYEDLTGNYDGLPFSAARMSRLRHWARVESWRWSMLVPQFMDPAWSWMRQSAEIMGIKVPETTKWNAPPLPMVDPDKEGLAIMRNVRAGIQTLPEAIRERGYNFDQFMAEYQEGVDKLDKLKIVLDSDPRRMTQQGLSQADDRFDPIFKSEKPKAEAPAPVVPAATPPKPKPATRARKRK